MERPTLGDHDLVSSNIAFDATTGSNGDAPRSAHPATDEPGHLKVGGPDGSSNHGRWAQCQRSTQVDVSIDPARDMQIPCSREPAPKDQILTDVARAVVCGHVSRNSGLAGRGARYQEPTRSGSTVALWSQKRP